MALELGGSRRADRAYRSSGRPSLHARRRGAVRRTARRADLLDEPPRHGDRAARGRDRHGRLAVDAGRCVRGAGARRSTASSSTRRSSTRRTARTCSKNFLYGVAGCQPTWTAAAVIEEQVERDPRTGRGERVLCAPLRRRRLRRSPRCSSTRRSASSSRASSSTTACCARTRRRRSSRRSGSHFHVPLVHVDAEATLPRPPRGRHRPGGEAAADRRGVHPRLRGGGGAARRTPLPRPGHALLGRDRVRRRGGRRGEDQVAPQRRRPARGDGLRARRAAALAVQGRGAARRRGARAARGDGLAPPVPRARPRRSGSSARSRASGSRSCARRTRSCSRRCAAPDSTASSGSASPSCRRSARSASRATSARTRTRS